MFRKRTYYVSYEDYLGHIKIYRDRYTGCIKEFSKYETALRIKNWFLDHGFENVVVKEIIY